MNWFKKFDRRTQPATLPVVQMPVGVVPPVVDLEKKIAEGVKAALYSAKHKDVQTKLTWFMNTYVPAGPRYKIRQHPEGGYIILERKIAYKNVSDASTKYDGYSRKLLPTLDDLEAFDPTPVEKYSTLCTLDASGKRVNRRFDSLTLAEFYLYRMAEPEAYDTNYDGDPLKRV